METQRENVYFGKVELQRFKNGVWGGVLEEEGKKTTVRMVLSKTEEAFSKVVKEGGKNVSSIDFHTAGIQNVHDRIISAHINECDCKKELANFNSAVIHVRGIEGKKLPSQLPTLSEDFTGLAKPLE